MPPLLLPTHSSYSKTRGHHPLVFYLLPRRTTSVSFPSPPRGPIAASRFPLSATTAARFAFSPCVTPERPAGRVLAHSVRAVLPDGGVAHSRRRCPSIPVHHACSIASTLAGPLAPAFQRSKASVSATENSKPQQYRQADRRMQVVAPSELRQIDR